MNVENEKLVRDFYNHLENYDFSALRALCTNDFTFYSQVDTTVYGVDGFIASESATLDGFKGFTMKPQCIMSEGNNVMAYLVFEGVHNTIMHGYEPTGKKVRISLMMLLTIQDGKIKEKRAHFDYSDILRQIK
ncbi:ester cyclase [Salmonella enterica]